MPQFAIERIDVIKRLFDYCIQILHIFPPHPVSLLLKRDEVRVALYRFLLFKLHALGIPGRADPLSRPTKVGPLRITATG
jgi:hypothetical protein